MTPDETEGIGPVQPVQPVQGGIGPQAERYEDTLLGLIFPNPATAMNPELAATLEGIPAAPGLFRGKAVVVPSGHLAEDERRTIPEAKVQEELQKAQTALREIAASLLAADPNEHPMLPLLGKQLEHEKWPQIKAGISVLRFSAAEAVRVAFLPLLEELKLGELRSEVEGIVSSLIQRVHEQAGTTQRLDQIPPDAILVGSDFNATSLRPIGPKSHISSLVTDEGGRMGHVPITARGNGWPAVTATQRATQMIRNGDDLIVDGSTGMVWRDPSAAVVKWYDEQLAGRISSRELRSLSSNRVMTLDGREILLSCNVDTAGDLAKVAAVFPAGMREIKLLRTEEDLLLQRGFNVPLLLWDEDAQNLLYVSAVAVCGDNGATIRLVDHGGEKEDTGHELQNPALGLRGIRYSLMHPESLMVQLRACCRATARGKVRIMAPMVTEAQEMVELRTFLGKAADEVESRGIKRENLQVGAMIEIGAATGVMLDRILKIVDFVSVGSNDLTQYVLGVDRLFTPRDKDGKWERKFGPHNPAVLETLCRIFDKSREAGIPASLCGELASIPFYAAMSVGVGATDFSVPPRGAWAMAKVLRHLHFDRCRALVGDMMDSNGGEQSIEKLKKFNFALTGRKPYTAH